MTRIPANPNLCAGKDFWHLGWTKDVLIGSHPSSNWSEVNMIILLGTCMSQFSYNFDSSKFLVPGLYRSKLFLSCLSFCQYCILNSSNSPWGGQHNFLHHKLAYSCNCTHHPLTPWEGPHNFLHHKLAYSCSCNLRNICTGLVFREIPPSYFHGVESISII